MASEIEGPPTTPSDAAVGSTPTSPRKDLFTLIGVVLLLAAAVILGAVLLAGASPPVQGQDDRQLHDGR